MSDISTTVYASTVVVKRQIVYRGRYVDMTLLERIQWVLDHRGDVVSSQSEWSERAKLARTHVNTLMKRLAKAPHARYEVQTLHAMADAARVSRAWLVDGVGTPDSSEPTLDTPYRYDSLREVVERFPGRWSDEAVAAVRTSSLKADVDPGHEYWAEQLDRYTASLKASTMPFPKAPDRGVDPLADLDDRPAAWPPKKAIAEAIAREGGQDADEPPRRNALIRGNERDLCPHAFTFAHQRARGVTRAVSGTLDVDRGFARS